MQSIFYLGPEGSFHHELALKVAGGGDELIPAADARTLCEQVSSEKYSTGLLAIENKVAGPVTEHLAYLLESGCRITGQHWLPVHHHLLAVAGTQLEDIREVKSHPMALKQCSAFLSQFSWKQTEYSSTSAAARDLKQDDKQTAVIASDAARICYGLESLRSDIEDDGDNATRFLRLKRGEKNSFHTTEMAVYASFYTPASAIPHLSAEAGRFGISMINQWEVPRHPLVFTEWIAETGWPEDLTHTFLSGKSLLAGLYGRAETSADF